MSTIPSILLRAIPGALIADSGISKLGMDAESSKGLQDFAATGIPQVKELPSDKFGTIIGASEVAVGGALLAPFVSNRLAGLALTTFGAGLLSIYFRNDDRKGFHDGCDWHRADRSGSAGSYLWCTAGTQDC